MKRHLCKVQSYLNRESLLSITKKAGEISKSQNYLNCTEKADFLAPLFLRLYLAPIMWMAGTKKFQHFSGTVEWFGNEDWGLGLPFPTLLAGFVTATEIIGAIFLLIGFAVRWASIPLLLIMVGAAVTVHLKNGWLAVAEPDGFFANARTIEAATRLEKAKEILHMHGNYEWLVETGGFVVLNNGVEFAATYAVMLLCLFFIGGGRFVSFDYWMDKSIVDFD